MRKWLESHGRGPANRGFTLLDLLMTMAILTVAAGLAIPAVSGVLTSYELNVAAQELASEMSAARALAVSRGSAYTVTFNVSSNSYQVIDISDPNNPTRVSRELEGDVVFQAVPQTAIRFDPRGLTSGGTVVLAGGSDTLAVLVDPAGKATVMDVHTGEVLSRF